jgi:hypothetical protein
MTESLAGTSPYKLWDLTTGSTVRCLSCHADSSLAPRAGRVDGTATPPTTDPSLAVHASADRGILIQNYRDRTLKAQFEPYDANDFALCYSCHAEAPFADISGDLRTDTNFEYHGFHVQNIAGLGGTSTDIDTARAGQGFAVCAECHFRTHSSGLPLAGQSLDGQTPTGGSRLVNYAPNVVAAAGFSAVTWTAKTDTQFGTCTLTCHNFTHGPKKTAYRY